MAGEASRAAIPVSAKPRLVSEDDAHTHVHAAPTEDTQREKTSGLTQSDRALFLLHSHSCLTLKFPRRASPRSSTPNKERRWRSLFGPVDGLVGKDALGSLGLDLR